MVPFFGTSRKLFFGDHRLWSLLWFALWSQSAIAPPVIAQTTNITSDGTLGTVINSAPGFYEIQGGTAANQNLFHSFSEFSVLNGDTAYFDNVATQTNIFARITGINATKIDGVFETAFTANLFLINPNGIEFVDGGFSQTFLDGGNFIASTASQVLFPNNQVFETTPTAINPLLLVTAPIGLNIGQNSQSIQVNGDFQSNDSSTFLIGNGLAFRNPISGKGFVNFEDFFTGTGDTALLSIAPNNVVHLTTGFPTVDGATQGNDITFQNYTVAQFLDKPSLDQFYVFGKNITLDNADIRPDTLGSLGDVGGDITFQAQENIILKNQSVIDTNSLQANDGPGNRLTITASQLLLDDSTILNKVRGSGDGEPTQIVVDFLGMTNDSGIIAEVTDTASGSGSDIIISANRGIDLDNSTISSDVFSDGNSGRIEFNSPQINITKASILNGTFGKGDGGGILFNGDQIVITASDIFSDASGAGNGGDLIFKGKQIQIQESAYILGDTSESGNGGNIFFDTDQTNIVSSFISSDTSGSGDGGDIRFRNGSVQVLDGSIVSSSSDAFASGNTGEINFDVQSLRIAGQDNFGIGSWVFAETSGSGDSVGVSVKAEQVVLRDGARLSASSKGEGRSGIVDVNASGRVELSGTDSFSNPTGLYAEVLGSGSGEGQGIRISTPQLYVLDGAILTAGNTRAASGFADTFADPSLNFEAFFFSFFRDFLGDTAAVGTGQPGDIRIVTQDLRLLNGAKIITNAAIASGGDITIDTQTLVALFNSDISANAEAGAGGRIFITAKGIFGTAFRDRLTPKSDITATSNLGPQFNGVVTITTPDVDPTSGLTKLPTDIVDASDQVAATCAAAKGNSFALVGRGGIPENPQVALTNTTLWQDLQSYVGTSEDETLQAIAPDFVPEPIAEKPSAAIQGVTGWQLNLQGQVELVTQVTAAANPDLIGCNTHSQTPKSS